MTPAQYRAATQENEMTVKMLDGLKIYRVVCSDGTIRHFPSEAEAHFYAKDTKECGFATMTHEIPFPGSAGAFADFCDDLVGAFRRKDRL